MHEHADLAQATGRERRREHEDVLDPLLGPHGLEHAQRERQRAGAAHRHRVVVGGVLGLALLEGVDGEGGIDGGLGLHLVPCLPLLVRGSGSPIGVLR